MVVYLEFCSDIVWNQADLHKALSDVNNWRQKEVQDVEDQQQDLDNRKCNIV